MAIITVICSGMMGSAITFPAAHNGHTIRLVGSPLDREIIEHGQKTGEHLTLSRGRKNNDTNGIDKPFVMPGKVSFHYFEEMESCIADADLIICGVSSFGMDWFCQNVIPKLPEEIPLLSISKGLIDDGENKGHLISYPEYMMRFTDKNLKIYAVGGPCTSYELAVQDPTEVTFCGPDINTLRWLREIFETDYYHISISTDVFGVECTVALKNAYALGIALAIGLSYKREGKAFEHYNSQAAIFAQSAKEMSSLLDALGASSERNLFLGLGDLYVTVYGGRNRKVGILLGEGYTYSEAMEKLAGITLEGVVISRRTAKAVRELAALGKLCTDDYPLLMHIEDILDNEAKVNIPWDKFKTDTELKGENTEDITLESDVVRLLKKKDWHISFAESCTAGMAAARLVNVPDASSVFDASFVTYANSAKVKYVGVSAQTIEKHGVVSEEVALEMAIGTAKANNAEVGVGISGIAGPGGATATKKVGMVCFGFYINGETFSFTKQFGNIGRAAVRCAASDFVYGFLSEKLL